MIVGHFFTFRFISGAHSIFVLPYSRSLNSPVLGHCQFSLSQVSTAETDFFLSFSGIASDRTFFRSSFFVAQNWYEKDTKSEPKTKNCRTFASMHLSKFTRYKKCFLHFRSRNCVTFRRWFLFFAPSFSCVWVSQGIIFILHQLEVSPLMLSIEFIFHQKMHSI